MPDLPIAVTADGHTKMPRYLAAGTAQAEITPTSSAYVGQLADDVLNDFDTNVLQATVQQGEQWEREEEESAVTQQAGPLAAACATRLHCNRTSAGSNAKLDFHGLVGLTCTHIIPLLWLFLPMVTYEQVRQRDGVVHAR